MDFLIEGPEEHFEEYLGLYWEKFDPSPATETVPGLQKLSAVR